MTIDQLNEKILSTMQDKGIFDGKIDYILQKDFDSKGHQYVCYISRKIEIEELYSIIIDTNGKIHSFDVANWDFNIEDFLFKYLENDYKILEMNADTHYGVWFQIDEMREEINYTDGLQQYLSYCKKNHIDKNFMKLFYKEIDVMDLYQEKNGNYKIIASLDIGKSSVVLGYNENSPSPYVTWKTTPGRKTGYYTGHYGVTKESAFNDYKKRCKECFNEHLNRESQKLGIKEKRDKGVER